MLFLHSGSPFGMHFRYSTGHIIASHDDLLLLRVSASVFHLLIRISPARWQLPGQRVFIANANAAKGVAFTMTNRKAAFPPANDFGPAAAEGAKKSAAATVLRQCFVPYFLM